MATGKRVPPAELCRQVDAMTADDLQRVAGDLINTQLTLAAYGDTTKLPKYDVISTYFGGLNKQLPA